jgi:hypothetical protein
MYIHFPGFININFRVPPQYELKLFELSLIKMQVWMFYNSPPSS